MTCKEVKARVRMLNLTPRILNYPSRYCQKIFKEAEEENERMDKSYCEFMEFRSYRRQDFVDTTTHTMMDIFHGIDTSVHVPEHLLPIYNHERRYATRIFNFHTHTHVDMHKHKWTRTQTYTCTHADIHIYTQTFAHVHTYEHTQT
ncbi:hypothetical protein DUNSADRAFT_12233 [Dunaliella salina]|uniref:Encoded protein n=1 Tax=Dunaliella salina TaxID=3046 RepID=A0ABQ7GBM3_DUNSA|nr:hypothetical protein DUNSADRAFT_12233 [Dunaliella salina]|eukprot:KAF5832017.1 hypothetical protein DUNSADRAFT_12233 [Dunaliella salina]